MSIITDNIVEVDSLLRIHNEGHWEEPYNPKAEGFTSFNDAGVECEVGEFLYSMARIVKPERVLETGTHWGVSTVYLARALEDNNKGLVYTFEIQEENWRIADKRFRRSGVGHRISNHLADVATFIPQEKFDLIFLDTEPQLRFAELVRFYDHLNEGGYVFIHDLHPHMHQIPNQEHGFAWPYGEIPKAMKQLVTSGKLRPIHFRTPRGFTGFYKVSGEDYKWI